MRDGNVIDAIEIRKLQTVRESILHSAAERGPKIRITEVDPDRETAGAIL